MAADLRPRLPAGREDRFARTLRRHGLADVRRTTVTTVQANLGKLCNMACLHCHVEAGPNRTEVMSERTATRLVEVLRADRQVEVLDLTGGAPEMCAPFPLLVREARSLGLRVIDRCNLTVLLEPGMEDLADFLAWSGVEIVASLPCYDAANVERQRGKGAWWKSVEALRRLNAIGYGMPGSALRLDLVYNPVGPVLPPPQGALEERYHQELRSLFGIEFHGLIAMANVPIRRFAHQLERDGHALSYARLLDEHFHPANVDRVMCRSLVSIGWDGRLHDCDFHQMAEIGIGRTALDLWDISSFQQLAEGRVATADHCLACTAGEGSSCTGSLT